MRESLKIHDELMGNDKKPDIAKYCCPIFITPQFGMLLYSQTHLLKNQSDKPLVRNGTLTFVSVDNEIYGITCRHVIDLLEQQNEIRQKKLSSIIGEQFIKNPLLQYHFFFPKGGEQVHINSHFHKMPGDEFTNTYPDIAAARIERKKFNSIGRTALPLNSVPDTQFFLNDNITGLAIGYAEEARKIANENDSKTSMVISAVQIFAPLTNVKEESVTLYAELDHIPEADNLSGMSGGPILWSDENNWGLIGIIKKGHDLKSKSQGVGNAISNNPNIWVDGVRISSPELVDWLRELPRDDADIPDLSKMLFIPSGFQDG